MLSEIERFVNWVRRRNPEARTWRDYGYDLHIFVQVVGDLPPRAVTFREVDKFIAQQSEQGFKPTTINRRLASLVALYAFLAPEDDDLVCPVYPRRHHIRETQHLPRPVPEPDLCSFFAVIPNGHNLPDIRDRAMFTLMLRCGLRIAEVAALQLSDLYLAEEFPHMLVRGKGSRQRTVYLSVQAGQALSAYLLIRPSVTNEYVFLSYLLDGLSTTAIHKRLMRYREQAGLKLTAHQFRHSFANDLLNADVPVTSIQKLLGHRWIESTQTYVLANDKQVCADYYAACEKLEGWSQSAGGSHANA
jgi:site-specific recombinase XerD